MARHHPRRQHRGRDDRDRRAARLRRTLQNHRPHPRRGQGRQPRRLRHDPEALRHDRVGIIKHNGNREFAYLCCRFLLYRHYIINKIDCSS